MTGDVLALKKENIVGNTSISVKVYTQVAQNCCPFLPGLYRGIVFITFSSFFPMCISSVYRVASQGAHDFIYVAQRVISPYFIALVKVPILLIYP